MADLSARPAQPESHYTILLVDDNPENLYTIGTLLQKYYRVRAVRSGAAAIESMPRPPPFRTLSCSTS